MNPGAHVHVYPFALLTHDPPFTHGLEEQAPVPTLHVCPVNPGAHVQRKLFEFGVNEQVPPFKHGNVEQGLMYVPHDCPVNPAAQVQVKPLRPFAHVPPF